MQQTGHPVSDETARPLSVVKQLRALVPERVTSREQLLELIELQAGALLRLWGYERGPVPDNVVTDLPNIRIKYTTVPLSGFSFWDGKSWVICLNADEPVTRQRFTLMHEFAHIVWHHHNDILFSEHTRAARAHLLELAASYFAGCVLL